MNFYFGLCVLFINLIKTGSIGYWDIYYEETIKRIKINNQGLTSTIGLTNYSNLIYLDLEYNSLECLGEIKSLTRLKELYLNFNQIESIDGISKLTNLTILSLSANFVKSIKELERMSTISEIYLDNNQIENVEINGGLQNLNTLNLINNKIKSFKVIGNLKKLSTLKLGYNKISNINLENFPTLENLDLSNNQIESICGIKNNSNLKKLNFNFNNIKSLNGIEKIKNLTILYLNSNKIRSVENLKNLTSLETLYLKNNGIESIGDLELLKNLKTLDVSHNRLKNIESLKNLVKVQILDLSNNQISSINGIENLFKLEELFLNCNLLKEIDIVLNLINLQNLYLNKNKIESINNIQNLKKLVKIEIEFNSISSTLNKEMCQVYKRAKEVLLSFNKITTIESGSFDSFNSIEIISLMNNNVLILKNYTFSNLSNVFLISLDYNQIEKIESYAFNALPKLKIISLRNNRIVSISEWAFSSSFLSYKIDLSNNFVNFISNASIPKIEKLSINYESLISIQRHGKIDLNIKEIDLSDKNIKKIKTNTIKGLFETLNLQYNLIDSFEKDSFDELPNLVEIKFGKNLLRNLSRDFHKAFKYPVNNLVKLDMQSNKISSVEAFENLENFTTRFPNLNELDFSNNNLKETFFLNMSRLKFLNLSNNQILKINENSFNNLPSLTSLNLAGNLIYDLSESLFKHLNNLLELNMSKNKLESINNESFVGLDILKTLDLSENYLKSIQTDLLRNLECFILKSTKLNNMNETFLENESLKVLDLSQNNITNLLEKSFRNIIILDLSNSNLLNKKLKLTFFKNLTFLNISKSNLLLNNLDISKNNHIQALDLNFNDLKSLNESFFENLRSIKKLYLKATNLNYFEFLYDLRLIEEIDLSNNFGFLNSIYYLNQFKNLRNLKISNITNGLNSRIDFYLNMVKQSSMFPNLEHLEASYNNLTIFICTSKKIISIDLSFNNINPFISDFDFLNYFPELKVLSLKNGLSNESSNYVFKFNKMLEIGVFTGNKLENFPKFCQICANLLCNRPIVNLECKLKMLYFDSNYLKTLQNSDFANLNNLETLNLDENKIESMESKVFINLFRLETLILSRNSLKELNDTHIFASLTNLKKIYLGKNYLEIIPSNLFTNLFKLKLIELSNNKIKFLEQFAFVSLLYLRDLYLHGNDRQLKIVKNATFDITTIQNIYVSRSILNDTSNLFYFVNLFKIKNISPTKRYNRSFFYSLFLISDYDQYDCDLTLFFIMHNIHFNFKTETDIFNYFSSCSQKALKTNLKTDDVKKKLHLIFSDFIFYFFIITLFSILFLTLISNFIKKNNRSLIYIT